MPTLKDALTRDFEIDAIKWLKRGLGLALFAVSLVIIYEPLLIGMTVPLTEADVFSEDVRQQIWPFFRFRDSSIFQDDLIADYYLSCFPVGYRLLYTGAARLADPVALSKLLPILGAAVLLATMARRCRPVRRDVGGLVRPRDLPLHARVLRNHGRRPAARLRLSADGPRRARARPWQNRWAMRGRGDGGGVLSGRLGDRGVMRWR